MAIPDLRREYSLTGLRRRDLEADPNAQFKKWFDQAAATQVPEKPGDVNAMTLAPGRCRRCRANAAAGVVGVDVSFPSGHLAPPAHGGCTCTVVAAAE